jgi:hypothetical protein
VIKSCGYYDGSCKKNVPADWCALMGIIDINERIFMLEKSPEYNDP